MDRLSEIQSAIAAQGLDGWLFFDHHGRDPLAYRVLQFQTTRMASRRWYYYLPAHGEPVRLVHAVESTMLDALPGRKLVYASWPEQQSKLAEALTGARSIAMQYSPLCAIPYVAYVDAGTIELVRQFAPDIHSSASLVQYFEARWTADQLESHLEAGRRVDEIRRQAFQRIMDATRAGNMTDEISIKHFILDSFDRAGLETDHGPIVAVNAHCSDPHYEPQPTSHSLIRAGDSVLIDMWAKLKQPSAVFYDITWTGFCGTVPPPEMQSVFDAVTGARDAAIQAVESKIATNTPIQGWEVDDAARNHLKALGLDQYFVHRTGHSIGTDIHGTGANMDNWETHDERQLIPQTCFSIEPGVYRGDFGIRSEVDVYIDTTHARVTGEKQTQLVTW